MILFALLSSFIELMAILNGFVGNDIGASMLLLSLSIAAIRSLFDGASTSFVSLPFLSFL